MATRFNKDSQVNNNPGEQRTEQAAKKGSPLKPASGEIRQIDHSQKSKVKKLQDKGFKDVC